MKMIDFKMTGLLAITAGLMGAPLAQAANVAFTGFTMDFVDIGNPGNANDAGAISTPFGGVGYDYRMGVNEVSEAMIDAYNTNSGGPTITKDTRGADKPATSVSWNEAARFVNWLNTSTLGAGTEAYKFTSTGANDNIVLWTAGDAGYDPLNEYRNKNARYFLPSEDEWYKAAYYDPDANGGAGGYWDYATGSDAAPVTTSGGTADGTAVYQDGVNPNPAGPADITNAGGLSPYGTMGQSGNVWEFGESAFVASDGSTVGESRVVRGGGWSSNNSGLLQSFNRVTGIPTSGDFAIGFRVAAVPEPSSMSLVVIGALGVLLRRKRR